MFAPYASETPVGTSFLRVLESFADCLASGRYERAAGYANQVDEEFRRLLEDPRLAEILGRENEGSAAISVAPEAFRAILHGLVEVNILTQCDDSAESYGESVVVAGRGLL